MSSDKIRINTEEYGKMTPKVEFYTHLEEIKALYQQGYKVKKRLYEYLKEKYNWNMRYVSFNEHFNKEFEFGKSKQGQNLKEDKENTPKEEKDEGVKRQTADTEKKGLVWDDEQEKAMRDYMETVKRQEEANKKREQEEIERKNR